MVPARPFFIGRPGWVRSSAWICDFSSTDSTTAWAGGSTYKPTMSVSFSAKAGSLESLKCRQRCGLRPWAFQIACTVDAAMPATFAIARNVQWVASNGGGSCVRRTISATRSGGTGALPGGRDRSRRRPSTPSCMNRSCQRQTQVLDLPVSAMIAEVPRPSPLRSTIRARQTCFCGLLGSATIAHNR